MEYSNRWEGIKEESGEAFLSYTFEQDDLFSPTALKALLSSTDSHLIKCVLMHWNGNKKCLFFTGDYRPLEPNLISMEAGRFREFMVSLIRTILNIRETSILKCGCIDLNTNHVFLDWNRGEIHIICLPISLRQSIPEAEFDIGLRHRMLQWIRRLPQRSQIELGGFSQKLLDMSLSLRDILLSGNGGDRGGNLEEGDPAPQSGGYKIHENKHNSGIPKMVLESVNEQPSFSFDIGTEPFLIGRSADMTQGHIDSRYNYVGRKHCQIKWTGNNYVITDLNSRNGTWVNGRKLESTVPCVVRNGDEIKLFKLLFRVKLGSED